MTLTASAPTLAAASAPHLAASAVHSITWLPADATWLSILQAAVPSMIALAVAWVGWRQLQAARAKLKLDLFEKRLVIFDLTWEALSKASRQEITHPNELIPLHNKSPEAAFLFGSDIASYVEMVSKRIAEQQSGLIQLHQQGGSASQELMARNAELTRWFNDECHSIKAKFNSYLSFQAWR